MNTGKLKRKELTVNSRTENLSAIRDFVRASAKEAGIKTDIIDNIMLAVDEACTNIIKHAYNFFPDGKIKIQLSYNKKKFSVLITDYGSSFHPEKIPDPDLKVYFEQHRVGGLGMYLMKTLMDEVKYESVPGKYNQVLLSKNI
ncbi:MAG: anti-sigma B factor RsbW [Ignavibacteriaceae bacterium]